MVEASENNRIAFQSARTGLALSLELASSWLLNTTIFAAYDAVLPEARDISMVVLALLGIGMVAAAIRRPGLFDERRTTPLFLALFTAGVALSLWGVSTANGILVTIGSIARSAGLVWPFAMLGIALMKLDQTAAALSISCAFVLKYLWMMVASLLPFGPKVALYVIFPFAIIGLVRRYTVDSFAKAAKSDSQANLQVTSPASFLPFTHTLFVTIVVFNAASGFSLSFGSVAGMPQDPLVSFGVLIIVALLVLKYRWIAVDRLFQAATLLILMGLLSIPALHEGLIGADIPWIQSFLTAGSDCFSLLVWFVITRLAGRNTLGALPMLLFLFTAQIVGTIVGAALGHLANIAMAFNPTWAVLFALTAMLLFVAYNLVTLKPFSFEETLTQVAPMRNVFIAAASATLEENCKKVALEYGLTPREAEIAELLARGRNSQTIQEKLVVSRNTVKTHVKNIYLKLNVHSQQELIDLVERA